MTVITTVLQLLIHATLLNSVYKWCSDRLKIVKMTDSTRYPHHSASEGIPGRNSWIPTTLDKNQYLQVDFGKKTDVKGISTQGRGNHHQFVKTYTISYSDDGENFKPYMNNKVWNELKNRQQKHAALRNQGHPTTLFCKVSVRRSKNCLEFSIA